MSANDLDVKLGNVDVAKSNIEVDDDTITITGLSTMNIAEGELVVKLGTSKKDFVGNTATSNTIVLSADNSALGVSTIQSIGCQDCGLNGILKVVITFNKPVAEVDGVEINTNDADIKLSYLLVEGNQVQFVYSVTKANIEKTIQLVSFSSNKIMDALGNVLAASELDLTDDSVSGSMKIDTKAPTLDSITSEAVGCTNNVCTTSGRVNVKLHFNEEVEEYDNLRIETNFGIFEHLMSAIVKSQVVVITVEVDDSIEDKLNSFIVTKITGNFYDKADNKLPVSEDGEVHKNTNITLDSAIPRVESVVIADAIDSNEVSGVKYYKSGDVFTVTVTFTDPLVNVEEKYKVVAEHLLGRILVVKHIDDGIALAKKYKQSLRIVTVEGELINPGGAMTGGAFKNSSNLLSRRREIEEIEKTQENTENTESKEDGNDGTVD